MSALMDSQCIDSNQKNSPNITGNIAECSPMDNKDVDASSLGPLKSGMGLFGMLVKKPVPPPKQTSAKTNNNQIRIHYPVLTKLSLLPASTTSNSLTTTPTKTLTAGFKPLTGNTITAISTTTTTTATTTSTKTTTETNDNLLAVTTAATNKTAIKGPATYPKPMVKQQNNNKHIDNSSDSPKSNSSSSINISNDEKAEITPTALHVEDGYEYDDPMAVDVYNLSKNINNTNNKPKPEEDVLYDEIHVRSELETQVPGPTNPFVSDLNRTAEEDDCYASFPYSDSDYICYAGNKYINNSYERNINTYSSFSLKKSALNDSNNIKSMVICPEKNYKIDDEDDEIYYKYDLAQPVIPEKKFPNRIPPLVSLSKFFDSSACNFDSIEMDINNNSISEISYDDLNDTVKPAIPEKTRNLSNQLSSGDQTSSLSSISSYDDKDDEDDNEVDVEAVRLYNCQTRRRWWYENVEQYSRVTEEDASETSRENNKPHGQRQLLKQNLVVELVENQRRKLRNLLLFDDVIVCAKQKRNNKFLVRWFITLDAIKVEFSTEEDEKNLPEHKISMKKLNKEYKDCLEAIKCDGRMKMTAADNPKIKKSSEANKKKLNEMEAKRFLKSPYLRLKVFNGGSKKFHLLLLSTEMERESWIVAIKKNSSNKKPANKINLNQVTSLINQFKHQMVTSASIENEDINRINGTLKITINKLKLSDHLTSKPAYCSIFVDSYGLFYHQANTSPCQGASYEWDEGFEIELEGTSTLRISCYLKNDLDFDTLIGTSNLKLSESTLKLASIYELHITKEVRLLVSMTFMPSDKDNRHTITTKSNPLLQKMSKLYFGLPLLEITSRENMQVPILISSCIEELEKRGLKDLGLYRVSGVYAAINKLKLMFDEDCKSAVDQLVTSSVHIITGVIKLFFRELPDSLIPISRYHTFINSLDMEPDEQSEHLIREVGRLPICNSKTLTFLLNHLNRVANQKECNSMTLGNLATIFGPNLFRQPVSFEIPSADLLLRETDETTKQRNVVLKLLTMVNSGCSFKNMVD